MLGRLHTLFQISKFILPLAYGKYLIVRYRPCNKPFVLFHTATGQYKQRSHTNDCPSSASDSTISSLLTLFSKFFSSFLRSTCMLSVSYKYLALGEVYLPIRAAFPNYPTLRNISYRLDSSEDRAFTFSGVLFQGTYDESQPSELLYRLQFYNIIAD